MSIPDIAIDRPVFTTMIIGAIVVFGLISYNRLGVDMFPQIDFPIATIITVYRGADPATVESEVSEKIEEAVSTINGIKLLRSVSVENVSQVIIQFELEVETDTAVQEVRDAVSRIISDLPADIDAPKVQKLDLGAVPILTLGVSGPGAITEISQFARKRVKEQIQGIPGVGSVDIIGGQEREIKVWLDPQKLQTHGLAALDVVQVLKASNMKFPGGTINAGETEFMLKVDGEFTSLDEIGDLIVMDMRGSKIRVSDVARLEDGAEERRSAARLDGVNAVTLLVRKQSGVNAVETADKVKEKLDELQAGFPQGWRVMTAVDTTTFTRLSIHDVVFDLIFGGALAVGIVFLFLRNVRSTIISALALPTSVIGTFSVLYVFGFTLNVLTLLGLSLSIGLLIDDAIVVVENIYRHMEEGKTPMQAAREGANEIALAVIAITMSIVAVFVPVAFMGGIVGRFFYQFGITIAGAVLISLFVSLTLTPMLSSRILGHSGDNFFYRAIENVLNAVDAGYRRILAWALGHRALLLVAALLIFISSLALGRMLESEFQPMMDQGEFNVTLQTPTGSSLEKTEEVGMRLADRVAAHRDLVLSTILTIGSDAQQKVNLGKLFVKMVPKKERDIGQQEFMEVLRKEFADVHDADIGLEKLNPIGDSGGFRQAAIQFNLRGGDLAELDALTRKLKDDLNAIPGFVDLSTTYESGKPEIRVRIDRDRAAKMGVMTYGLGASLRALVGGMDAGKYKEGGEDYNISVRLEDFERRDSGQIAALKVRSNGGALVSVDNIASITPGSGPTQIDRQARMRQITLISNLEKALPLGRAVEIVKERAAAILPPEITTDFEGEAKIMKETQHYIGFAMVLAIVLVYMVLASQFESFIHPFTIMISLPLSLVGALGGLLASGMTLSMFSMIGIIMLFGLVTKNAILVVDYTNTLRRRDGMERLAALLKAGPTRLRPILMTTAAMVFGMLPVALSHGEGAEIRTPMAVCVIGGLITSTLLTLVVVPVVYTVLDDIGESRLVKGIMGLVVSHGKKAEQAE